MKQIILSLLSVLAYAIVVVGFYTWAFYQAKNADDCQNFVIYSYEVHSEIDIPKIEVINCYYDEREQVFNY